MGGNCFGLFGHFWVLLGSFVVSVCSCFGVVLGVCLGLFGCFWVPVLGSFVNLFGFDLGTLGSFGYLFRVVWGTFGLLCVPVWVDLISIGLFLVPSLVV